MKAQRKTAFWPFISTCRSKSEARLRSRGASRREIKGLARALRGDVSHAPVCVACNHVALLLSSLFYHLLASLRDHVGRILQPAHPFPGVSRSRPIEKERDGLCFSCFLLSISLAVHPSSLAARRKILCFYIRCRHKGVISSALRAVMGERKKEVTDTFTGSFRQPATKTMSGHYPAGTSRRTATVSRMRSNRLHGEHGERYQDFLPAAFPALLAFSILLKVRWRTGMRFYVFLSGGSSRSCVSSILPARYARGAYIYIVSSINNNSRSRIAGEGYLAVPQRTQPGNLERSIIYRAK